MLGPALASLPQTLIPSAGKRVAMPRTRSAELSKLGPARPLPRNQTPEGLQSGAEGGSTGRKSWNLGVKESLDTAI